MVKIKGPLMSVDASGKFADSIVFQHNIYGIYVRRKEVKRPVNTFYQLFQNAMFSEAIENWRRAKDEIKKLYEEKRELLGLTGYSAFLKEWFSYTNNAVYGYGKYGITTYGVFHNTMLKKNIF